MADQHIKTFNSRLRRVAKIRRRGGGFEADGTLGQSYYTRRTKRSTWPLLRNVVYILFALVAFKAVILAHLGPADYLARVNNLQSGGIGEQLGAAIMAADPMTVLVSQWIAPLFG